MNVLHFLPVYIPAWSFGGPVLSVSRLCEGLVSRGLNVRVLTTTKGIADCSSIELQAPSIVNGVTVYYYKANDIPNLIWSSTLLSQLEEHLKWADILHLSSIWHPMGIRIAQIARRQSIPYVQSLRGALGPYSWKQLPWKKVPYYFFLEKPSLQKAAAIHCTSVQEQHEITHLKLKPPVAIIPNPVSAYPMSIHNESLHAPEIREGSENASTRFVVAGRIHHKKGLDILPEALAQIPHSNWTILFIGNDADGSMQELKQGFSILGLDSHVTWITTVPPTELFKIFRQSDWLLLPSRHENFGNVVIEALLSGCGAIISDKVGVASELSDCPGATVLPRDTNSWADALTSATHSNRPGSSASEFVYSNYSIQAVSELAQALYEQILQK